MFTFFKILQKKNKWLRKSYEYYFIDKFKPSPNKKTWVTKPPKIVGFYMTPAAYLIPRQRQISKTKW